MRFWLDRGVDGFRIDVLWHLIKDVGSFRDNPINPAHGAEQPDINRLLQLYPTDQPEVAQVVAEMRQVVDAYADRVLMAKFTCRLASSHLLRGET
jgi:alpha-glucosidase